VFIDDHGKRWDVDEALNDSGSPGSGGSVGTTRKTKVILERWRVELGPSMTDMPADLAAILPVIYKKSIVLFRSLFTYSKFLPSWKFGKRLSKQKNKHRSLTLHIRIANGNAYQPERQKVDPLDMPLDDKSVKCTENYSFGLIESPAGPFSVSVCYRTSCDFRVDDSESLLSSHFMGVDEDFFQPSFGSREDRNHGYLGSGREVGSLPAKRGFPQPQDQTQAYGSLSSFHQVGAPAGSSPISALRRAGDMGGGSGSPSPPNNQPQRQSSLRSVQGSKSSLRSEQVHAPRRPSVSFQPFKTPSLSASPGPTDPIAPQSPRNSLGRYPAGIPPRTINRNPTAPIATSSYRGSSIPSENAVSSSIPTSSRPASISRYSSSFGGRKSRLSVGAASKIDDDNNSSGRGSAASSAAPGSGMLTEGAAGGSSGSLQTDDDNISDFLKMLDLKKDLKSFSSSNEAAGIESSRRTTNALSKFQRMRDSNTQISDSISSSALLHRSSSTSSRHVSNVPQMVPGTSISTSSSPGKPVSPHTPHTPAIPSRLSANSMIAYDGEVPRRSRAPPRGIDEEQSQEDGVDDTLRQLGTTAPLDIPTSPRQFPFHNRRSSSVTQQHRNVNVEDETGDILPFGHRSASLGDDRPPLSLSALLDLQESAQGTVARQDNPIERTTQPPVDVDSPGSGITRHRASSSIESREYGPHLPRGGAGSAGSYNSTRPRLGSRASGARGLTPPHGSVHAQGGRYSFPNRPQHLPEDDEPLLFDMSEIGGQHSRRSIEDAQGGDSVGGTRMERGGSSGGASDNGRRGSRRGVGYY
jgi:autophagy-related protein 13